MAARKKHHYSTSIRHRQVYSRYKELVAADRDRLASFPQMIYKNHYYCLLSDEFGYDCNYICRIVNEQEQQERESDCGNRL